MPTFASEVKQTDKKVMATEVKDIRLTPIQLAIDAPTGLLSLTQGSNTVKVTRDDVFNMGKLREGKFDANGFTSNIISHQHFAVDSEGNITISCKDDYENTTVVIRRHRRVHDFERIQEFVNHNKAKISWDRDFRGRR
jgi:hypothetical protein